jgi:hypothetical protein
MRIVRVTGPGLVIFVFATVVALSAFWLSSQPLSPYLRNSSTPPCEDLDLGEPGFDPWTGSPHGWNVTCTDRDGQAIAYQRSAPAELSTRMAIPVPVGFFLGAIVGGIVLWLRDRLRRDHTERVAGGSDA